MSAYDDWKLRGPVDEPEPDYCDATGAPCDNCGEPMLPAGGLECVEFDGMRFHDGCWASYIENLLYDRGVR